ncbi:MAG: hypothetical protein V1720_09970 [bacterium]
MEKYLKAIRENICSICVDSDEKGDCKLTDNEICAVESFFPQILEIVHRSNGEDYDVYTKALKEEVCKKCRASEDGEYCYLREDSNCALDRYFPLIIEIIQKVDAGKI